MNLTAPRSATSINHLNASLRSGLGVIVALEHRAQVLEINLEPTELSRVAQISLRGKTGELLPQIVGQAE